MCKREKEDPIAAAIQRELMPGRFVPRNEVFDLTGNLDQVHEQLKELVVAGEAERAVSLYELLLSGIYAKIEECDDECYLAMTFTDAFCGWIKARQTTRRPAAETVSQILKWMANDDYGFCYDIERKIVEALDREGQRLFIGHFEKLLEEALPNAAANPAQAIFERENDVRLPALSLKKIYESLGDAQSYARLCETLGFSPRDCERLATMEKNSKHWAKALDWVEKGIELGPVRNWHNEGSYSLEQLKPEILRSLGRHEEALTMAWAKFQKHPDEAAYVELMRYAPGKEKALWQERAMAAAGDASLGDFLALCVKAKEWGRLAKRVLAAKPAELEAVSHFHSEPAAQALAKKDAGAAAKLYRALGLHILNARKSKYHYAALQHLEKCRDLYCGLDRASEWQAVVEEVRRNHSRKSGFLSSFERLASGGSMRAPSFAEQARERWKRLTS